MPAAEPWSALAIGIRLSVVATEDGGRHTPLLDASGADWAYRPNWGLPSMRDTEQTGAPVVGFSQPTVYPGEAAYAVIVPLFPQMVQQWKDEVRPGVVLPMFEGSRVCGHGTVLWIEDVDLPLSDDDRSRYRDWLRHPETPVRNEP